MKVGDYVTVTGHKEVCQVLSINRHGVFRLRMPDGKIIERISTDVKESQDIPFSLNDPYGL